ncbi:MAG TPA: flagellar hook-basal body complex protein FliE [Azospirillaceae bacterium]|nr:flagellar hook-basal body complex protein FliE [Azospirillaceae bacterium]
MAVPISSALAAYANTAAQGAKPGMGKPEVAGPSFGDLLEEAAKDSLSSLHRGEAMTAAGVMGRADLADVVNAVSNAEVTLQAVTAVRDKVIGAYQEILRMPM